MNDERTARWMSIHPEETFLVKRLDELIEKAALGTFRLSFFVDPRGLALARARARAKGVALFAYGGYEGAERVRLLFAPDGLAGDVADGYENSETMELGLVEVHFSTSDETVSHRAALGALLGLGIKRDALGDILLAPLSGRAALVTTDTLAPFIAEHLHAIGRTAVRAEVARSVPPELLHKERGEERSLFASSLRLDALLKEALHLSRERAQRLIQKGAVKVSFRPVDAADFPIEPGDVLSVRGYGRIYIDDVLGQSKKGRIQLRVRLLLSP
ncbi:MAG: hypothetical protein IMX04_01015 [Candidatus Carbobacillus altaicus]|nr:hypothetical protein [Candidatus Carbobacillus altaicus]